MEHPTTAGLVKVIVNSGLGISTLALSGGTLISVVGWGMSFADKLYNYIGNGINNLFGYDVGLEFSHDSRTFFLQTKLILILTRYEIFVVFR